MKPKKRQKLCYNCEGEIDLDVIVCPYCAADLRAEKPEQQHPTYNPAASVKQAHSTRHAQTNQSLYPSSSQGRTALLEQEEDEAEEPTELPADPTQEYPPEESSRSIWGPTLLMTLGAQLLLLGLMMFFFSHKGVFTLKWDARLWFFYILASAPLLIFGYKSLSKP